MTKQWYVGCVTFIQDNIRLAIHKIRLSDISFLQKDGWKPFIKNTEYTNFEKTIDNVRVMIIIFWQSDPPEHRFTIPELPIHHLLKDYSIDPIGPIEQQNKVYKSITQPLTSVNKHIGSIILNQFDKYQYRATQHIMESLDQLTIFVNNKNNDTFATLKILSIPSHVQL